MSPEQAEGRSDIDARSDVFSFGVMFYEMVAGIAPFTGTTSVAIMYAVLHREPEPLEALCPDAPAAVATLVARCLRKLREERFASGRELVAALEGEQAMQSPEAPSGRALPAPTASTVSGVGTALGATLAADVAPVKAAAASSDGRGRVVVLRTGLLMVALVGVVLCGKLAWRSRAPVAPAPAASSSAAPRITTITDRGLPESAAQEARTEYAAGLQLLRDDNYETAQGRFAKAAELESSMALPHLRLAVLGASMGMGGQEKVRAELAKAAQMRAQLDERDRVLLDAVEPLVGRTVPDEALAVTRLMAARERFPLDEEFVRLLAETTIDDPVNGPAFARAATELDPRDAAAWECLGRSLGIGGDLSGARVALERCAGVSTESADCYNWLALLDGAAGRCADMEREATRQADGDEKGGNQSLACALLALGRPEEMVREALARAAAAYSPDMKPFVEGVNDAWLATTSGRFDVALARLDEVKRLTASSAVLRRALLPHATSVGLRVQVLREMGNEAGAKVAAREFTDGVELMARGAQGSWGDVGHYWWIARAADVPLDPGRREWVELQNKSGAQPARTWMFAWAQPAMTPEEATLALTTDSGVALPRGGEVLQGAFGGEAATGRIFLLAGKPADAIPYLKRAANNCLALVDAINHFHAELDLGRALEQTNDNDGACDEYRKVVAQWGRATPRSVSAEAARSGMKRLACPP
jgi:serine/threonine-protein kinase